MIHGVFFSSALQSNAYLP